MSEAPSQNTNVRFWLGLGNHGRRDFESRILRAQKSALTRLYGLSGPALFQIVPLADGDFFARPDLVVPVEDPTTPGWHAHCRIDAAGWGCGW